MRYFEYVEPDFDDPDTHYVITVSEEWLRAFHYPSWYGRMIARFPDRNITFEDCLDEFEVVYWAIQVPRPSFLSTDQV